MKKISLILSMSFLLSVAALPVFASQICTNDPCVTSEVGVFMDGISRSCGNTGDCSMDDIMQVFHNIGNYVLGISGSLVLLMYVIGGLYLITSRGNTSQVQKGIKYLQVSTVGLVIVFVAYAGVKTLESVLRGGDVLTSESYVTCGPGEINEGEPCGEYMRCSEIGTCESECDLKNTTGDTTGSWMCADVDIIEASGDTPNCVINLCPGDESNQCCYIEF
ncbi:TPA: hypothetical protein DEP34_04370 [Candidatus Uhrbacteria bacterium]|uniref:Transmembrane protein n=1 Tax=Candidatus Uhrbacteria bacterium GW2011_GWE2_46_68 TaxID=1618994 RepID=A0A0G1T7X8_9BACT|nr:MAG: hypothetical protein UX57_C0003G0005 [Candidatus Uhrbacteria bacterium GW2011_GWE2_46_68]HBK33505.1 hypothetical protein [Candidatus Uhrbacteria bacterium]HCB19584.1 hypothetical protein [Candidatus Uhrbacteria bacterium]